MSDGSPASGRHTQEEEIVVSVQERVMEQSAHALVNGREQMADARNVSEAILQLMAAQGVDYIFLNPGTDTAPLQEAIVAIRARGQRVPRVITSLFEGVAMAAAQGLSLIHI